MATSLSSSLFQAAHSGPLKISVVGSGNFGSVIAKIVANNAMRSNIFHKDVRMWVFEEMIDGQKLTDVINTKNENVKYLPGCRLPSNLRAVPNLIDACKGSDLLVFVVPHQFLARSCEDLYASRAVNSNAKAISCIKGLHVEGGYPVRLSQLIQSTLRISDCSVLSGANVANDIAKENFCECTIGYKNPQTAMLWQLLFDAPYFKVNCVPDPAGVEVCGALKNIVALAAGFAEGLGLGSNTKAALLRIGVEEMRNFSSLFFSGVLSETFLDSAGFADVITTAYGGRNARCAAEFVRSKGEKSWETIEKEMLNGQKLQGTLTTKEVYDILNSHGLLDLFPLFACTYRIAFEGHDPKDITGIFQNEHLRPILPCGMFSKNSLPKSIQSAQSRVRTDFDEHVLYPNQLHKNTNAEASYQKMKKDSPCSTECHPNKPIVLS